MTDDHEPTALDENRAVLVTVITVSDNPVTVNQPTRPHNQPNEWWAIICGLLQAMGILYLVYRTTQ